MRTPIMAKGFNESSRILEHLASGIPALSTARRLLALSCAMLRVRLASVRMMLLKWVERTSASHQYRAAV
jgi:hypothetical protein